MASATTPTEHLHSWADIGVEMTDRLRAVPDLALSPPAISELLKSYNSLLPEYLGELTVVACDREAVAYIEDEPVCVGPILVAGTFLGAAKLAHAHRGLMFFHYVEPDVIDLYGEPEALRLPIDKTLDDVDSVFLPLNSAHIWAEDDVISIDSSQNFRDADTAGYSITAASKERMEFLERELDAIVGDDQISVERLFQFFVRRHNVRTDLEMGYFIDRFNHSLRRERIAMTVKTKQYYTERPGEKDVKPVLDPDSKGKVAIAMDEGEITLDVDRNGAGERTLCLVHNLRQSDGMIGLRQVVFLADIIGTETQRSVQYS